MKKVVDIFFPYKNNVVVDEYLDTITLSLQGLGYETRRVSKITRKNNKNIILVVAVKDVLIARFCGYKKVLLWCQGIIPEESFDRRHSHLRFWALSKIEFWALKRADFIFFVSDAMRRHYVDKYKIKFKNYFIMPCFNSEFNEAAFEYKGKYENNVFIYAGGLQSWQCFEYSVKVYKMIEDECQNTFFRVLTKEKEKALETLNKYGVRNFSIDFLSAEAAIDEMKKAKFGFSLREDTVLNRVSTPTKLSTYVTNGVFPIYSSCLESFDLVSKENQFAFPMDIENIDISEILENIKNDIDTDVIYKTFFDAYGDYYNKTVYINKIKAVLGEYLC